MPRGYGMPGGAFNNLDANLDLIPFDSISNPGRTAKDTNPITRLAQAQRTGNSGGMRPEIDSFYADRQAVKTKQQVIPPQ